MIDPELELLLFLGGSLAILSVCALWWIKRRESPPS